MKVVETSSGSPFSNREFDLAIFVDNHVAGGVATFLETLLPRLTQQESPSLLIINREHPGLPKLVEALPRSVELIVYTSPLGLPFFTRVGLSWRLSGIEKLSGAVRRVLEYFLLIIESLQMRRLVPLRSNQRVLIINGGYPGSYLALAAVFAWAKHCVIYLNCHSLAAKRSRLGRAFEKCLDLALARRVSLVIANSFTTQTSLQLRFGDDSPDLSFVYNAIEVPSSRDTSHQSISGVLSQPVLGLIAVLEPRKGHLFALKLLKKLNENRCSNPAVLKIIGPDPYNFGSTIKESVSALRLSGMVQIVGQLAKEDIYRGLDLVIVPSEQDESFGLVAIESLSRAIPVVASSVGAIPEVLTGSPNASVVEGWNLEDWIAAIEYRLDQSLSVGFKKEDARLSRFVDPDQMVSEFKALMGIAG